MTTKAFLDKFNNTINIQGRNLLTEFFISFSRFECALKASNFVNGNSNSIKANWDSFVGSIRQTFISERTPQLKQASDYIVNNPPRIQIIENGHLGWRDRVFQISDSEIDKLSLSIRDIRNNLFHGGKFNGIYERDVSRNYILINAAMIILNEWLKLSEEVQHHYLKGID